MKLSPSQIVLLTTLLAVAPLGCSKSDSTPDAPAASSAASSGLPSFDLSQIEGAFSSATGTVKAEFDKIVATIKGGDYSGALSQLQALAGNASLSADQKSALSDLVARVKAKGGDVVKAATGAAGQAVDQAKEAAGKAVNQATDAAGKAAENATDAAKKAAGNLLPK